MNGEVSEENVDNTPCQTVQEVASQIHISMLVTSRSFVTWQR